MRFPTFYGTQMFITMFTTAQAKSLQSPATHCVSWGFILITIPFQVEVFQVIAFLQVLQQNPVYTSPAPLTCHMPHPSDFSWYDLRKMLGVEYRSAKGRRGIVQSYPVTGDGVEPLRSLWVIATNWLTSWFIFRAGSWCVCSCRRQHPAVYFTAGGDLDSG